MIVYPLYSSNELSTATPTLPMVTQYPRCPGECDSSLEKELGDEDDSDGSSPQAPSDEASPPASEPSPPSDSQNVVAAAGSPARLFMMTLLRLPSPLMMILMANQLNRFLVAQRP